MTAGELHDVLADVGADLIVETIHKIENGKITIEVQDNLLASRAPKIFPKDCEIDFNQTPKKVHDFIRGLSPYPAAYSFLNGKQIRLYTTHLSEQSAPGSTPGEVIALPHNKLIRIQCLNGSIDTAEVQLAAKKRMHVADFLRGYKINPGIIFGEK
jgi:methionyl-tRNA formyltransferase